MGVRSRAAWRAGRSGGRCRRNAPDAGGDDAKVEKHTSGRGQFTDDNYLMRNVSGEIVGAREPKVVERAIRTFSDLDGELDKLEAETRSWGRHLLDQADRLAAEARGRLLDAARAKGEDELKAVEEEATARAEEIMRTEEEKLRAVGRSFEEKKEELIQRALKILLPNGED